MRAVAQDKKTAALMGIDVNDVISKTFVISGALAGAAGVMWGIHNGLINYLLDFYRVSRLLPLLYSAVSGAYRVQCWAGFFLGIIESIGPAALGLIFN